MISQEQETSDRGAGCALAFLGITVVLFAAYLPAVQGYYVYHDDYYRWAWTGQTISSHPLTPCLVSCGRPVLAVLICAYESLLQTVHDANILRSLTILHISFTAALFFLWLQRLGSAPLHALFLVLLTFSLPAFQVLVGYTSCVAAATALWPAALALLLIFRAAGAGWPGRFLATLYIVLALVCLLFALFTYQNCAMFYWAMLGAFVVLTDYRTLHNHRSWLSLAIVVGLMSIALYACAIKLLPFFSNHQMDDSFYTTAAVSTDVVGKLRWFCDEPLTNLLNLWSIRPTYGVARAVGLFILLPGLCCALRVLVRALRQGGRPEFLLSFALKAGILLGVILLCYLPNLMAVGKAPFYRTLVALYPLTILLLYAALNEWARLVPGKLRRHAVICVLAVASAAGLFRANYNVANYIVIPNSLELRSITTLLRRADLSQVRTIHVLRPETSPVGVPRYDEFACVSTLYPQDIPQIIRCALREVGKEEAALSRGVCVTSSLQAEYRGGAGGTLVIDMTAFPDCAPPKFCLSSMLHKRGRDAGLASRGAPPDLTPRLIEEGYRGFNIILCDGRVYGLAQDEGAFSFEKFQGNGYRRCAAGATVSEVRRLIDALPGPPGGGQNGPPDSTPRLLIEGYHGWNLIAFDGRVFGLAQDEGAFDLQKAQAKRYRRCVCGATVEEVRRLIDVSVPVTSGSATRPSPPVQ